MSTIKDLLTRQQFTHPITNSANHCSCTVFPRIGDLNCPPFPFNSNLSVIDAEYYISTVNHNDWHIYSGDDYSSRHDYSSTSIQPRYNHSTTYVTTAGLPVVGCSTAWIIKYVSVTAVMGYARLLVLESGILYTSPFLLDLDLGIIVTKSTFSFHCAHLH